MERKKFVAGASFRLSTISHHQTQAAFTQSEARRLDWLQTSI